jgi:hypothetical protein
MSLYCSRDLSICRRTIGEVPWYLWLSRGEPQRLLSLRLFELPVNIVEHAIYITEAPKPRSPGLQASGAGPIVCSSSCVLLHMRHRHHRNPCASMNNAWIVTVMSGYHGEELLPSQTINTLDRDKILQVTRICGNF